MRPVMSIALPFLCRRRTFFRPQRLAPRVVCRQFACRCGCAVLGRRSLRLRPGDLFKSCLAAFLDHLQLALARLLHSDSGARVQSLMALRFQLQKTVLETDHQVVGDQPLGPQEKHPIQVQTLR